MVTVKVEGGEELVRKLQKMGVDVDNELEIATTIGARVIANAADGLAPAPEIETETVRRRKGRVEVAVGPPDEKWYWRYLETGATAHEIRGNPLLTIPIGGEMVVVGGAQHPGMAAQPFLRPAFDMKKDGAVDALGGHLKKVVEK